MTILIIIGLVGIYALVTMVGIYLSILIKAHPDDIRIVIMVLTAMGTILAKETLLQISKIQVNYIKKNLKKMASKSKKYFKRKKPKPPDDII